MFDLVGCFTVVPCVLGCMIALLWLLGCCLGLLSVLLVNSVGHFNSFY